MLRRALIFAFACSACVTQPDAVTARGEPTKKIEVSKNELGEPASGYPNDEERMVHVLLNLGRHSTKTPNNDECSMQAGMGTIKKIPLVYSREANIGARFFSRHMSELGCYQHESCCVLGDAGVGIGCVAPGSCTGMGCQKNCDAGTGQGAEERYALFGHTSYSGESIQQGINSPYDFWCAMMNSAGNYGGIIDDGGTQVGIGRFRGSGMCNNTYFTIAYGNAQVQVPRIPAASALYPPLPLISITDLSFMANYFDPSGKAPQRGVVVVNGHCFDLERAYGFDDNGTYVATFNDPDVLPVGCHPYYFVFQDGDGQRTAYPTAGSFLLPLGPDPMVCSGLSYDPSAQIAADCETGIQQCPAGAQQSCFTADPSALGKGECRQGYQVCKNGFWSACKDMIGPFPEICDGLDNDCDGQIDEGNPGGNSSCAVPVDKGGVGICQAGTRVCTSGRFECISVTGPQPEVCDNLDNDCDGAADDGFNLQTCGVGECFRMVETCVGGQAQSCDAGTGSPEIDDQKDNDCNGFVDDGIPCTIGTARQVYPASRTLSDGGTFVLRPPCRAGTQQCQMDGGWGEVFGAIVPKPEECNNQDDDCDGLFDNQAETLNRIGRSRCGVGTCMRSVFDCRAGVLLGCDAGAPGTEICDGLDNSCDGVVDEACSCRIGDERPCYTGPSVTRDAGVCHGGRRTCVDGGYTRCTGEVKPSPELCNSLDDDCDGTVDEMCLIEDGGAGGAGGGSGTGGAGGSGTGGGGEMPKGCGCTVAGGEWLLALALVGVLRRGSRRRAP